MSLDDVRDDVIKGAPALDVVIRVTPGGVGDDVPVEAQGRERFVDADPPLLPVELTHAGDATPPGLVR